MAQRPDASMIFRTVAFVIVTLLTVIVALLALYAVEEARWWLAGLAVLVGVLLLISLGYSLTWTGFGESRITKEATEDVQRARTLWDWLQLLIVSAMIAGVGLWFSGEQGKAQRESAVSIAQGQQAAEDQRAQDTALQSYIDQMSQLMGDGKLRNSQPGSDERALARTRTLTVLRRATDADRKRTVVRFLYEGRLIRMNPPDGGLSAQTLPIVTLADANLIGANLGDNISLADVNLSGAQLRGANLAKTNLTNADLSKATMINAALDGSDLTDANLSGANLAGATLSRPKNEAGEEEGEAAILTNADFTDADLSGANLQGAKGITNEELEHQTGLLTGTTMPDGSTHD